MRRLPPRVPLIINLVVIAVLLASCNNTTVTSTPPPTASPTVSAAATGVTVGLNSTPTGVAAAPTPAPATTHAPAAPSSADRITAAEAAGTLDHDSALLYQLYAAFDPAKVPVSYKGDDRGPGPESSAVLDEISARWDSLPAAVQAGAAPFFRRPSDPASFWNQPPPVATSRGRPPGLAAQAQTTPGGPPPPTPAPPQPSRSPVTWASVDSAQTRTRVWYAQQDATQAGVARQLAQEIDASSMWATEKRAMLGRYEACDDARLSENGGDGRLDVYLVGPGENAPRNIAPGTAGTLPQRQGGTPASGVDIVPQQRASNCLATFILLNNTLDFPHLKSAMAHELFHAFQHSVSVRVLQPEYHWWKEASATWAEDLVYPALNFEQPHLDLGGWANTRLPLGPLPCGPNNDECPYGGYLWPFYLTHRGGTDPTEIGRLWAASAQQAPLRSMTDRNDWADRWKEFALWNWNEGPADKYRDNGQPIAPLIQTAHDVASTRAGLRRAPPAQPWPTEGYGSPPLLAHGPYAIPLQIPAASMDYYVVGKPEREAAQLRFDLGALAQKPGIAIQAIVTIGDPARPDRRYVADWSSLREKKFCLDRKDENATNVVLVVSNSGTLPEDTLDTPISVVALRESCPAEANLSYTADASYRIQDNSDGTIAGQATTHEEVQSSWEIALESRETNETTYIFTATNTISLHGDGQLSYSNGDTTGKFTMNVSGSGTSHNPTRPGDDFYQGHGAVINPAGMNMPSPTQQGMIRLYRNRSGQDVYAITLAISPIKPSYTYHARLDIGGCEAPSSYDEVFSNDTRATDVKVEGPCPPPQGNPHFVLDRPFLFGVIIPDRNTPNPATGGSDWIGGTYDPSKGILEGSETVPITTCDKVANYDPLDFGRLLSSNSRGFHYSLDAGGNACTMNYTLKWRIQLPQAR